MVTQDLVGHCKEVSGTYKRFIPLFLRICSGDQLHPLWTPAVVSPSSSWPGLRRKMVSEVGAFRLQGFPGFLPEGSWTNTSSIRSHQFKRAIYYLPGNKGSFLLIYPSRREEEIRFIVY